MGNKVLLGLAIVAGIVGAGIGINSAIGGKGDLPQIADKDDDNNTLA